MRNEIELNRRGFLKGIGACMALPAFESILGGKLLAAAASAPQKAVTATGAPLRTALVYFPNGVNLAKWRPDGTGSDYILNQTMEPLSGGSELAKALSGVYAGTGTVTSWRLVSNEGREYLEITLGW